MQLEHPSLTMGLPLEDLNVTPEERAENITAQLKESSDSKRALIIKVSHIGGHKYAGNCIVSLSLPSPPLHGILFGYPLTIFAHPFLVPSAFVATQIYTPAGSGIWYGRVTPHDVDSIVVNTIIDGLVLPPLLRGGVNLSRPNCKTLNDW